MRLSQHSDYAFRMLIRVALRAPALSTVEEVAQDLRLPATHLHKVAQTLARHGYLHTVRGRGGGLGLARPPEMVRLGQVAAVTEPDFQIAPCMSASGDDCPIYDACILRTALSNAGEAFLAELDKWTLADLLKKRRGPLLAALAGARTQRVAE